MTGQRCLHFCTSDAWGGLELYACTLMIELQKAGAQVCAVCRPGSRIDRFLQEHHVATVYLPTYAVFSLRSLRFLRRLIPAHGIGILHVHFHTDIWLASLALIGDTRRKLLLSIYMGVGRKTDPLHRFIYRRVDAILTSSEELSRRLPELYPVERSKIHFLPYGRTLATYTRDESARALIRRSYGLGDTDLVVGTMVRIDPGKGVMDFARAFPYIDPDLRRSVRFLIVGEPTRKGRARAGESPFEEHCEAYLREIESYIAAEELRESVLLAGFQQDVRGYLSAMDVFVFPSRDELYSLVVLDAMAMGLPVVAARAGGNVRQIEEGVSGLLYAVADSADLARKISRYLSEPGMRTAHGQAARRFVEEHHDMVRTVDRLLEFYSM